jgi:pyruvate-formate lyase
MAIALETETVDATRFAPLSKRIQRFQESSRLRGETAHPVRCQANLTDAFFTSCAHLPFPERYAHALAQALENEPVYLFPDERLVGMLYQTEPPTLHRTRDTASERLWAPYSASAQTRLRQGEEIEPHLRVGGAPGHVGWRWERILARGIAGHMDDIRAHLADARDERARQFYQGALVLWESVLRWIDRHVMALRERAVGACGEERARLERLADMCSRVPRYPARTFHEAVQSYHMQHLAVMFENPFGGNSPGRLDYFLWPYLERDLDRGVITLEEAKDLVDELFIRLHERINHRDGWVEAVMVGGVHPDGSSSLNPFSYMMIESIGALGITHPSVYTRLRASDPPDFIDLNVRYLLWGGNRAQIYNEDACLPAIIKSGLSLEDAAMYMAGGCMEISAQGTNSDLNFACTHNVAKTLELVLNGGKDLRNDRQIIAYDRKLADYADFEDLYTAFEAELDREYRIMTRALDIASECYAQYRPCYMLSSLILDCLERGREQQDGGARYHYYGFAPLGITAAADSLTAIRQAVYELGIVSAEELLAALRANYQGYEALGEQLSRLPHYGREDVVADDMCDRVLQSVCTAATRQRNRYDGQLRPMIFNFVWTPTASQELGARPDGTRAGGYISHGMTPNGRAMTKGITAAMNSCLSLDYACVSGGATTMWDMDEQWITFDLLKALLLRFLQGGGMIFQGNMTSVKQLEDAYEHPERYPNLTVRVGGFSARFNTLDRDVQREIIERHRHRS